MAYVATPHEVHVVSEDSSAALLVVVGLLVALFIGYLFFRNTSYFNVPTIPSASQSTQSAPAASDAHGGTQVQGSMNGSGSVTQ